MTNRIIAVITVIAFTNLLLGGCTTIVNRQFDEVGDPSSKNVSSVVTKQGEEVKFNRLGGTIDTEKRIVTGISDTGQPVNVALDEVDHLKIRKTAVGKSLLWTTLVIGSVVVVAVLVSIAKYGEGNDPIL